MLLYARGPTCPPRPPRCRIFKDWQIKGNLVVQSYQLSGVQSGRSLHQFLLRSSSFPALPLAFCVYVCMGVSSRSNGHPSDPTDLNLLLTRHRPTCASSHCTLDSDSSSRTLTLTIFGMRPTDKTPVTDVHTCTLFGLEMGLPSAGVAGMMKATDDPFAVYGTVTLPPYAASSSHLWPSPPPNPQ